MKVPIATVEGNIGAGKTILLNKFEQFLSDDEKAKIKIEHEPLVEFESFHGNDSVNPLTHFYQNPKENAFIFQNYVLDVYEKRLEKLMNVQHPCKVILMDGGLDSCHLFTTINKKRYTNFGFLYLTEKYLQLKSKFFPGRLYATDGVFCLGIDPSKAMKCITTRNRLGEDQITQDYLELLNWEYSKYVDAANTEVPCCTVVALEEGEILDKEESYENKLLTFIKSMVKGFKDYRREKRV